MGLLNKVELPHSRSCNDTAHVCLTAGQRRGLVEKRGHAAGDQKKKKKPAAQFAGSGRHLDLRAATKSLVAHSSTLALGTYGCSRTVVISASWSHGLYRWCYWEGGTGWGGLCTCLLVLVNFSLLNVFFKLCLLFSFSRGWFRSLLALV